jgi:hypothetical protein
VLLKSENHSAVRPEIVCHDQEPLNYAAHQQVDFFKLWMHTRTMRPELAGDDLAMQLLVPYFANSNFYAMLRTIKSRSIFDKYVLLHSEKNSKDVENFSTTAEPAYYWCHGIIARDWYRFAEHDARLEQTIDPRCTFLVYCRAWTGTREYRLKFLDLLIEHNLIDQCQTSILHQDQDRLLSNYICQDSRLQPINMDQLIHIPTNQQQSSLSADYCADDFVTTNISIVLETVAADTKIHLTEKTLRPIACGHPFMLIAGPGSLEYLRSYGFKTFSPWIDESYDHEHDVVKRMQMIVAEMTRIKNLKPKQKELLLRRLKKITSYNKTYFFSNKFFNILCTELSDNLNAAVNRVKHTQGRHYRNRKIIVDKYIPTHLKNRDQNLSIAKILRQLRQNPEVSIKKLISDFPNENF